MTKAEKDLIRLIDEVREFIYKKTQQLSEDELSNALNKIK